MRSLLLSGVVGACVAGCVTRAEVDSRTPGSSDQPTITHRANGIRTTFSVREVEDIATPIWTRISSNAQFDLQTGAKKLQIQMNGIMPSLNDVAVLAPPRTWLVTEATDEKGQSVLPKSQQDTLIPPRPYTGDPDYWHTYPRAVLNRQQLPVNVQLADLSHRPQRIERLVAKGLMEVVEETKTFTLPASPGAEPQPLMPGFTGQMIEAEARPTVAPRKRFDVLIRQSADADPSGHLPTPVLVTLQGDQSSQPYPQIQPAQGTRAPDGGRIFRYAFELPAEQPLPDQISVVFLTRTGWREVKCIAEDLPVP